MTTCMMASSSQASACGVLLAIFDIFICGSQIAGGKSDTRVFLGVLELEFLSSWYLLGIS